MTSFVLRALHEHLRRVTKDIPWLNLVVLELIVLMVVVIQARQQNLQSVLLTGVKLFGLFYIHIEKLCLAMD